MKQLSLKEIQDKYASGGGSVSSAILRSLQRDPRAGARRLYKVLAKRYEEQKKERNRLDAMLHFERTKKGTESSGCHAALRTAALESRHPTHRRS